MADLLTRRVKIGVQYIGTKYCGWQSQKNAVSVQDLVERAVGAVVCHDVRLTASGRTDEGVHARRQVAHFDTTAQIRPFGLIQGANVRLPDDVALLDAEYVDSDFDARRDAKQKTYVYRMYADSVRKPFLDINHLRIFRLPDIGKMREAARKIVGKKDFSCFCATGGDVKTHIREVFACEIETIGNTIEISVTGNAFLYNMVRIIAGTLLWVGRGKIAAENISEIIASGDRSRCGKTLPAHGLTLESVVY